MSSNYFDKSKYSQIHKAMYNRFRILKSEKFSRTKKAKPVKYNNYQYFPIESDNSKMRGRTIYLATQDEDNDNKDNNQFENICTEPERNSYNNFNNRLLNRDGKYIAQRTIFFSYIRKYNFSVNKFSHKKNNQIHISDIKIYDINKDFNEVEENIKKNNNINNNDNNTNIFNIIEAKQTTFENQNEENNNNINRIPTYRKKITSNNYKSTLEENHHNKQKTLSNNIYSKIDKFIDTLRNKRKEESLKKEDELKYDNKTLNLEERQNAPISKNSSLNEYLNITMMPNVTKLNRSLDEEAQNKNMFYKSLNGNILDNIDSTKIMEKKFFEGIKNQQRKTSLLKAMERYNRFKFRGKFNLNENKIENKENMENIENKIYNENVNIKADIKVNEEYNNNEDEMKNENKNSDIKEDEIENENEFSFNSELRKNDKKNHLEEIVTQTNNNELEKKGNNNDIENNEEKEANENNEEKEDIVNQEDNLIENIGTKIKNEEKINKENIQENDNLTHEEIINNNNNNSKREEKEEINVEEKTEERTEEKPEEKEKEENISEQKEESKEKEKISVQNEEKEESKEIIQKEEAEKIIKPEINISIEKKEDIKKEKIIPEINISIDNKDSAQENKTDSNNNNSSSNNIINNSINININNNDSFQKNEMREQKQYMQLNNIKYKNNLKPGYFIRKVVREEHYYVDENGKEKILQVKQEFINNEDKKKMKTKNPHKKKFINTGKKIYYNNINKTTDKNVLNTSSNKKDKFEKIEEIKIDVDKHNGSFDDRNNIIDISTMKENKDIDNFSLKDLENKHENIVEKKIELKDPFVNDNLSSASGPLIYPNNNNDYYKQLENNAYSNYNKMKNNNNCIYKRRDQESNIINISNLQTDPNKIIINRSKNLETKTRLIKPVTKKDYISNLQLTSSEIKKISTIKTLNDSNKPFQEKTEKDKEKNNSSNINKINVKPFSTISDNNYIKVNKTEKYKKPIQETYHKLNINLNSLYNTNTNVPMGKRRRESSKNHTYHEINLTSTKNNYNNDKDKLSSNSLSHYFNEGNDELNTSTNTNNTNKLYTNSNITERNFIHRYTVNTNRISKILDNDKSIEIRTTRFHRNIKDRNETNNSVNKEHHRYYESKSLKKRNNYNHNIINHQYSLSKNLDDSDKKEYKKEYINRNNENINKKDKGYFYSYCDIGNNNNSQTAKKTNRTTTYYH